MSSQLVRLIDLLFALVLVQGAVHYRSVFGVPSHIGLQVVLALLLVYYTVVRSFIDWHIAMESAPYRIMRSQCRTSELRRVYVDFLIVALYSFMLLKAHVLLTAPDAGLRLFFWSFPVLYALYLVWGWLRARAYHVQQFSERLLVLCLGLSIVLAAAYEAIFGTTAAGRRTVNSVALASALVLMACFRHFNWRQQPVIARDSLTA